MQLDQDRDNILLERPELEQEISSKELTAAEQVVCLGLVEYIRKSYPKDDIITERIQAYTDVLVSKAHNWLVFSQSLLQRSLNEAKSTKRRERSILQLDALIAQYAELYEEHQQRDTANTRLHSLFQLQYPSHMQLNLLLANWYMKIGSVLSSEQIFSRLGLKEEQVDCLAMAGQTEKATKLALEILE